MGSSRSGRPSLTAIVAAVMLWAAPVAAQCVDNVVDIRGSMGASQFTVEIADTMAERSRGLMFRRAMPRGAGMLFVYPHAQSVAFWMKNTFIPLDLVFLDAQGVVQHVHPNAIPQDLTAIPGGNNILAVLEINAGLARSLGIVPGSQMRHPAFGANAAWQC